MNITVSAPFERHFSNGSQSFCTVMVRFDNAEYESWPLLNYLWSGIPNSPDGWPIYFDDSKARAAILRKHREVSSEVKFFKASELEAEIPAEFAKEITRSIRIEARKHLCLLPATTH